MTQEPNTLTIPLTRGQVTVVDREDAWLATSKWHLRTSGNSNKLYAGRSMDVPGKGRVGITMHRLIALKMGWDASTKVRHLDGDGLNNTRANLVPDIHIADKGLREAVEGLEGKILHSKLTLSSELSVQEVKDAVARLDSANPEEVAEFLHILPRSNYTNRETIAFRSIKRILEAITV